MAHPPTTTSQSATIRQSQDASGIVKEGRNIDDIVHIDPSGAAVRTSAQQGECATREMSRNPPEHIQTARAIYPNRCDRAAVAVGAGSSIVLEVLPRRRLPARASEGGSSSAAPPAPNSPLCLTTQASARWSSDFFLSGVASFVSSMIYYISRVSLLLDALVIPSVKLRSCSWLAQAEEFGGADDGQLHAEVGWYDGGIVGDRVPGCRRQRRSGFEDIVRRPNGPGENEVLGRDRKCELRARAHSGDDVSCPRGGSVIVTLVAVRPLALLSSPLAHTTQSAQRSPQN